MPIWDFVRHSICKKGIRVVIQKNIFKPNNTWIISGYEEIENKEIKKDARESLEAVIAKYGNHPTFSVIRKQIGALTSYIDILRMKLDGIN